MKRLSALSAACCALVLAACAGSGSKTDACAAAASGYHCVRSGDTLYKLSQRYNVSVAQIKSLNNLRGDTIHVGQSLRVSGKAAARSTAAAKPAAQTARSDAQTQLQWPLSGSIIVPYSRQSQGIDIAAPVGTPVKAAADGTVIYTGSEVRGYGKLILIRHSDTMLTAYAHNDSIQVAADARVKRGQTIATVGLNNSGESALHFEVRINGKHVNPMPYLPAQK